MAAYSEMKGCIQDWLASEQSSPVVCSKKEFVEFDLMTAWIKVSRQTLARIGPDCVKTHLY
jgi:hypothetical protein